MDYAKLSKKGKSEKLKVDVTPIMSTLFYMCDGDASQVPIMMDFWYDEFYDWVLLKKEKNYNELRSLVDSLEN